MSQSPVRELSALLAGLLDADALQALPELQLTELMLDSRTCIPGCAFVAVPGLTAHGLAHVTAAIDNGARVVLWQPDDKVSPPQDERALYVRVPALSTHLGVLANRFYGAPSEGLRIAAITGTNGKSTTAYLLAQAAEYCGMPAGYIGTVGVGRIGHLQATAHTTADVLTVHRQLAQLHAQGVQVVAMEVSSHALHQDRIAGVQIDTAVFTNLTQDHLDYHLTMAAYGQAKALLFARPGLRHQVINADDEFGRKLLARAPHDSFALTCSTLHVSRPAIRAQVTHTQAGLQLQIECAAGSGTLKSALLGRFNADNLLGALGVLLAWRVPLSVALPALAQCLPPPGRMEMLHGEGKRVVIDYAHTPDALAKALQAVRLHCVGQVICVFGCGGDRDAAKRPLMGRVAAELADQIILTDDNPRTENPEAILRGIITGLGDKPYVVERDRARAIGSALGLAAANDIVLIAGKGHEDYQIIGEHKTHFSDREVVAQYLRSAA